MKIFNKILAFILLLIWGFFTMIIVFSVLGAVVLNLSEKMEDWFCGGKQLLQTVIS